MTEFWCPYCQEWIDDLIHKQDHHNDLDHPDDLRSDKERNSVRRSKTANAAAYADRAAREARGDGRVPMSVVLGEPELAELRRVKSILGDTTETAIRRAIRALARLSSYDIEELGEALDQADRAAREARAEGGGE